MTQRIRINFAPSLRLRRPHHEVCHDNGCNDFPDIRRRVPIGQRDRVRPLVVEWEGTAMNIIVDLFVFFGLFALLWTIIGRAGARAAAGAFGVLALTIAAILGAGSEDDRRRDW
jgi:hypothetical protein